MSNQGLQNIMACCNLAQHRVRQRRLAVFADKKCVYLLMEYVPGGELFTRLREACAHIRSLIVNNVKTH